ncbi:coiled-coil domain-containing protein 115 [Prorops nasuta]|uniref:coiled-coil domain-containing protein 115 n=1 Tax=Prorops nasuta TaxID=863751 RepID=UPI0034CF1341
MVETKDDICQKLDEMVINSLELMEDKISINFVMEKLNSNGYIEFAKVRYLFGKDSVSILKIPVDKHNLTSLFNLESCVTEVDSKHSVTSFTAHMKTSNPCNITIENPIKWFGILIPKNLKIAQTIFQDAVFLSIRLANVQLKLLAILVEIERLLIKKKTMSNKVPDLELKKAFTELHEKMIDTTQKLKLADIQIESLRRSKQHAELTLAEITSFPKNIKTYESVGRMFLHDDIDSIKSELGKRMKASDEKIKTLENNKSYLQRNLKESENNLREMVQQRQNKDSSG